MGTEMHAHIEVLRNDVWYHFAAPILTNRIIFAAINGKSIECFEESFQKKIHPKASCKGFPSNASEVTKICYKHDEKACCLNGAGVLTSDDINALQDHLWKLHEYEPRSHWMLEELFHTYINGGKIEDHHGWDDARIVFWYDG